jgi:large conductance mechanosensitive channel
MIGEFRKFILRGNVIDLAVAVVIGAAFTAVINSMVNDIINPIIGLILGGVDLSNIFVVLRPAVIDGVEIWQFTTLAAASEAGAVTLNIGNLLNAIINFLIVGLVLFLIIKSMNRAMVLARLKEAEKPEESPAPDPLLVTQNKLIESIEKLTAVVERNNRPLT